MINWYHDLQVKENPKIAVVTCSYVGKGSYHYWEDPEEESKHFDDVKFMLNAHETFRNNTLPYDLIMVDNGSSYVPFKEFAKRWAEGKNHIFLERENDGFSFGAHEFAWNMFGDKYDFYIFHEQDFMPAKEHWLEEVLLAFYSEPGIGMVGGMIESGNSGERFNLKRETVMNLSGMWMFTSSSILKECGIQVVKGPGTSVGVINEVGFAQPILEKGYKIKGLNETNRTYSHLSDGSAENIVSDVAETIVPMVATHTRNRTDEQSQPMRDYFKLKGLI